MIYTQTFAIRFASAEIAQEYKTEFLKAQAEMSKLLSGIDAEEGTKEADEVIAAIESLTVKSTAESGTATESTEKTEEDK